MMGDKQSRHARLIHANADSKAGYARLTHFKQSATNAVLVTDAHLAISQPLNREVFAELPETEIVATQELFPVVVGIQLVDEDGALLSTVAGKVALRVAIDVELAHHPAFGHRQFPHRCSNSFAVPCHFAWYADIYREQPGHSYRLILGSRCAGAPGKRLYIRSNKISP